MFRNLMIYSLVIALAALVVADDAKDDASVTTVTQVENFRLLDQAGRSIELYRAIDAPAVVLYIHGIGCPIVRRSAPELNRLHKKYGEQGVVFYMLNANSQDSRADLAEEAEEFGWTIPILKDPTQRIVHAMGSRRTAEALVLDPKSDWKILYRGPLDDRFDYGTQKSGATHRWVEEVLDAQLSGKAIKPHQEKTKGCLIGFLDEKPISYTTDVAPILQAKCLPCHRKGGVAPFAMSSHRKVKGWATMIRETLRTHRMPPWHADPAYQTFHNSLDLTVEERRALLTWVEQGALAGDGEDPLVGKAEARDTDWALGSPDHVVQLPEPQKLLAEGVFDYRYITVASGLTENRWLKAVEVLPTTEEVVHHALIFIMYPPQFRHLQPDPKSGLDGFFASYLPGGNVQPYPQGTAQFVPAGSSFIFQMHYNATGKGEVDQTRMGLYYHDGPPREVLYVRAAAETEFEIPAGATDHPAKASFRFDGDATLLGLSPHMHYRGSRFSFEARYPDSRKETLLSVPWYEFDWQPMYYFEEPISVPGGTRIVCEGAFDNSRLNPRNPNPNERVYFGEQSDEEMFIGYVSFSQPYQADNFKPADLNPDAWPGFGKDLTEKYLIGTTWAIGDRFRLRFEVEGKLIINDRFEGQWRFNGETVHVKTRRREVDLEIQQDALFIDGRPLYRIPAGTQP
ncbi:MAG: redoxin domain-containing protein [Candidatus Hydrogenedentes bacterium]|nr:redoxin domain-containing protein [Candidatus Hydrogenedentota bacterium]